MLHHQHRVAGIHQPLQHVQELLDVGEVQARGRLVEDVERAARAGLCQFAGELHPLRLAARELRRRLAEGDVAKTHVDERAEDPRHVRHRIEELRRVGHAHLQYVGDVLAVPLGVERFGGIAAAAAGLALHPHVGQEVHFHPPLAQPLAGLATAAGHVEGERPRRESAGSRLRHL